MSRARRSVVPAAVTRSRGRWGGLALLGAIVLLVGVPVVLVMTPWLGHGLLHLLPSEHAQRVAGIALPASVLLGAGAVACCPRGTARRRTLVALTAGLAVVFWLVAPVGRAPGLDPEAERIVPTLLQTAYRGYLVFAAVAVVVLVVRRLRRGPRRPPPAPPWHPPREVSRRARAAAAAKAAAARAGGPSAPEGPADPIGRYIALGVALPVAFVLVVPGIGIAVGSPVEPPDLRSTSTVVPALLGTSLSSQVVLGERVGTGGFSAVDFVTADVLTEGQPRDGQWLLEPDVDPTSAPDGARVTLTATDLAAAADPAVVAARLASVAGTPSTPVGAGWTPTGSVRPTVAVLDGRTLLTLAVYLPDGTSAEEAALLGTLAGQLDAPRRADVLSQTRPAR